MFSLASDYEVCEKIGEGTFSVVYKVRNINDGKYYAEKRMKKPVKSVEEVTQNTEIQTLRRFSGMNNLLDLKSIIYDAETGQLSIITDLYDMTLLQLMQKTHGPISKEKAVHFTKQLLTAVSGLHSLGIFHRDIKPENCLIKFDPLTLVLCDFGSIAKMEHDGKLSDYVSTRWYRAPEVITGHGNYGPPIDIWAIGCMLYEMTSSRPLFPGTSSTDQLRKITDAVAGNSEMLIKKLEIIRDDRIINLLVQMLKFRPESRITAQDALKLISDVLLNKEPSHDIFKTEMKPEPIIVSNLPMINRRKENAQIDRSDFKMRRAQMLNKGTFPRPKAELFQPRRVCVQFGGIRR